MDNTISGLVYYCGESSNGKIKLCDELIGKRIYDLSYYKKRLVALCPDAMYDILEGDELMNKCDICQLSNGKTSCIGLSTNKAIYSWGDGHKGELGLGLSTKALIPVIVNKLKGQYMSMSSGPNHTMVCNTDGHVYGFGQNIDKQLALYSKMRRIENKTLLTAVDDFIFAPRLVPFSFTRPVQMVACGSNFTVFLTKAEGHVYTCGSGDCGQLGVGSLGRIEIPTKVEFMNGGDNVQIAMIACGFAHVLCCSSTGTLYSFGLNSHGQLGCGSDKKQLHPKLVNPDVNELSGSITKIIADGNSSAALTTSGCLLTWGNGQFHRLFQADDSNVHFPKKAILLEAQNVGRFTFGPTGSSVCVASVLKSILPDCGPVIGLKSLRVIGNGLWDSGKVFVKFSSENNDDFTIVCDGKVIDGTIMCQPPDFPKPGVYYVSASLNGDSYLPGIASLYIHPVMRIRKPMSSIINRKISSFAMYKVSLAEDSTEIPSELFSRDVFVKLQLSLVPYTNKLATNVCRRETLVVKGRFVNVANQDGPVIEVLLHFASHSLLCGSDLVYIRPSISLNGVNYSRYCHDSTVWLTHAIIFQDLILDRCLMDLEEEDSQFHISSSFYLSVSNMMSFESLPVGTSMQVVFDVQDFPGNIALPINASHVKSGVEILITPPKILDFYNLYAASIVRNDINDDDKQRLTVPTHITMSYRFELVFRQPCSELSPDDDGSVCEEEDDDDEVKLSMKSISVKLVKEMVVKVSLSTETRDDCEVVDLAKDEVDKVAIEVANIHISDDVIFDANETFLPVCIDLDVPTLSLTKYTPHSYSVSPQHIRINTGEDVLVAIEGLRYEPVSFHVAFLESKQIIRQVPSSSTNRCGFYLPSDILQISQLPTINQLCVSLVLDPNSSALWPLACSPTISLYSRMSLAGGGKSKPGSNVQFTISQFRLVDGLETLSCLVRIRESLPVTNASAYSLEEDLFLDLVGIITSTTKEVAKGKPPGPLITKLSFTSPSLNDLVDANMAVDKKFPKGDKRKPGSYFVGLSIDGGKSFDFTEKALLEVK